MRAGRRPDMAYNEERLQAQEAAEEFERREVDGVTNELSKYAYVAEGDERNNWHDWLNSTERGEPRCF